MPLYILELVLEQKAQLSRESYWGRSGWGYLNRLFLEKSPLSNFQIGVETELFSGVSISLYNIYPSAYSGLVITLCPTLLNPMNYSLPDTSVDGISQARILEWVAISFFKDLLYSTGNSTQ